MTSKEFNDEFDIQYNSISTNSAPKLDLYEKSVYLTRAQLELVKDYFNPNGNKYKTGFEQSSKRRADLKELIKNYNSFTPDNSGLNGLSSKSQFFKVPAEVFLIIQEQAITKDNRLCKNINTILTTPSIFNANPLISPNTNIEFEKLKGYPILKIVPKTHDEFNVQIDNPFRKPNDKVAWRIDYGYSALNSTLRTIELISEYKIDLYRLRYIKYPKPIILTNLTTLYPGENLTIDNVSTESTCELHQAMHKEILDRAVELALVDYKPEPSLPMKIQMNQRNE
jgi:hypothetical protein